jgi:shikimate dehydrogenase
VTTPVRGSSATYGVLGWPVDHSLSPAIHNAGFESRGLDAVYVPLPVPPGRVGEALAGLSALGFRGANVTMPHKSEVADRVDVRTPDAEVLRAVNTIVVGEDGLTGHNTDAPGFERMLRRDEGFEIAGTRALILGAGGAARACALALARGGAARLCVAVRDPSSAGALRDAVDGLGVPVDVVALADAADQRADLLVNATPLGAAGEDPPTPDLAVLRLVVDLLYQPAVTPLLARARAAGVAATGGLGLLLHQAALAFELWTGQVAPLEVMSAAAVAAVADRD